MFGVGVRDTEGISDPLLEGAESTLQVVAGLLLANEITDPKQLRNAKEIKDLTDQLAAKLFVGSSVGNILQFNNGVVSFSRSELRRFFDEFKGTEAAKASA